MTTEFSLVSVDDGGYQLKPPAADQVGANWIVYNVASVRPGVVRPQVTAEREPALEYERYGAGSSGPPTGGRSVA
ncbi:hypothetical protein AB0L53_56840 [Nonomuraea sp. NPDC052129]|uniref:hypothetical protein n=1 Tax=Nonomuraea sp. NPDC052129 TaxID=3154651 RepID=UPI00342EF9EC